MNAGLVNRDWVLAHRVGFMWIQGRFLTCMPPPASVEKVASKGGDDTSVEAIVRQEKLTTLALATSPRRRGACPPKPTGRVVSITKAPAAPIVKKTIGSPKPRQGSGPSMRDLLARVRPT